MTLTPEPRIGDVLTPALFPGATFRAGDAIDADVVAQMNRIAEEQGWSCRFELIGHGVRMFWPEPDHSE